MQEVSQEVAAKRDDVVMLAIERLRQGQASECPCARCKHHREHLRTFGYTDLPWGYDP